MKHLRVFIIEGTHKVGELLRNLLEKLDISISGQVATGKEALALIHAIPTDVVLMNYNLAGEISSIEAVKCIQEKIGLPVVLFAEEGAVLEEEQILKAQPYYLVTASTSIEYVGFILQLAYQKSQNDKELNLRKSAIDAISKGLAIVDMRQENKSIVYANEAFLKHIGYKAEEVIGHNLDLLKGPDTNFDLVASISQANTNLKDFQKVLLHYRKDGSAFWNEIHFSPIHDVKGQTSHIVVEMSDVTHKKLWEADALRSHRLESIGRLTMGVAHDLNNILAPILIAAQSLQAQKGKSDTNLLNAVETSVKRGAGIVKQLLGFARTFDTQKVLINPRHLLQDVEKIVRETFPKTLVLKTDIPSNLWSVPGDATQLYQVLLNLLVNARDAMPEGGQIQLSGTNVKVDETFVHMQPSLKPGPHLLITVEDSGVGIDPEIIGKIFDPFFSTKNPGMGTGLGLHIAQTIVKSMQGEIIVKSTKGKGSTFKIILPAITEKSPPVAITVDPLANCPKGNGELVLIVDDEATFLQVAQDLLVNYGYKVISALNGMEGLNLYHRHEKDLKLVLTDLLMPVMDGFTFIRTLSNLVRHAPIVAITGADTKDKIEELNRLGIRGFLEKPFTTESLLSTTHLALTTPNKEHN